MQVLGPFGRGERERGLQSGADVVVIATTSFFRDVAADVRAALEADSNVVVSAEESAFPWLADQALADELDGLARARGKTVVCAGMNPGFLFDSIVVTATGPARFVRSIRVERSADMSLFSETILKRVGIGFSESEFEERLARGQITAHTGFDQQMTIVGKALGVRPERFERTIKPLYSASDYQLKNATVRAGETAGVEDTYIGYVDGSAWYTAIFIGHIDPVTLGKPPRDEMWIDTDPPLHFEINPGLNPQAAAPALLANSVRRVAAAQPGWLTVVDLPPAAPL